jgi:peptide/nickel transport system substrate-binding protein
VTLLTAAAALVALVPASARPDAHAKYGGTLVVGLSRSDPATLDPTVSRTIGSREIYFAMCLRLYETNSKLQLTPQLAAALPVLSKDKLGYTIQLRQGIQFNDGTPLNAQAIVVNYQRYTTYALSSRADDFASVESVTASGRYTVVYHLKARDSTFTGNMYVLSPTQLDKLGDDFAADPVCVGPFMFDHRVVGDHITLIKSPWYYDRKNVYLDKIIFRPVTNVSAAAAALKAGDIDVLDRVDTAELQGVQQDSSLRVLQSLQIGWQGVVLNLGNKNGAGNPPYANPGTPLASSATLRQAFEEAIDRKTLNRVVFGGLAQPSCTPIPPSNVAWYEATQVPCTPYNPKHAKQLVAASGFANPTVHLLNGIGSPVLAEFIKAQEEAVGINVVIESADNATNSARMVSGNFDAALSGGGGGDPDPSASIYGFLATSQSSNYSGYSNPRLDLILANGLKATGVKARSTLYRAAQQIIASDRPIVVLYNAVIFAGFSANVTGVQMTFVGLPNVAYARFK